MNLPEHNNLYISSLSVSTHLSSDYCDKATMTDREVLNVYQCSDNAILKTRHISDKACVSLYKKKLPICI